MIQPPPDATAPAPSRHGRLFIKYVASLVGLVAIVLIGNGALDVWFSYNEAKQGLIRIQQPGMPTNARSSGNTTVPQARLSRPVTMIAADCGSGATTTVSVLPSRARAVACRCAMLSGVGPQVAISRKRTASE